MPKHLLKCDCSICYHEDEKSHGDPCNAYITLIKRSPAAIEIDQSK